MKVMILAAGEGRRLLPLTQTWPKPMLCAEGCPLVEHHVRRLRQAGFREVVINLYHLGYLIQSHLGDGAEFDVNITYSEEHQLLETGGGILLAQPLLSDPFALVNGDVLTDFPFAALPHALEDGATAHLVLVDNPAGKTSGDFSLDTNGVVGRDEPQFTYSGIAVLSQALFAGAPAGPFPLRDLLFREAHKGTITGEYFNGIWNDIGSPAVVHELGLTTPDGMTPAF